MSILLFLAVLFVLVLVHELGHFVVAKWTGMRVDEFGIGFPPKLFGIKRGETEYTFNLFPVGGFVKIFGEDGAPAPSSLVESEAKDSHSVVAVAETSTGGVTHTVGVQNGSFTSKSKWAQSAVLIAGVTMNVLFAWVLVVIAFSIGIRSEIPESDVTAHSALIASSVLEQSPAGMVGLPSGAVLKSVVAGGDSLTVFTPSAFSEFVGSHRGEEHLIAYMHNNELSVIGITPQQGVIAHAPDQFALGVSLTLVDTVERTLAEALIEGGIFVVLGLRDITVGICTLILDAVTLKADFSQVAGPVGIVGLVGEASAYGIATLLLFTAFISLNLAVINILPFPALDGGRLLFVLIEGIKGSPIEARFASMLNAFGFFLLIALMVAVTWNDIVRLM